MTTTKEELRLKLPGYEKRDMICCEKRKSGHNKSLTYVYGIRGFMDKLLFVGNFWVESYEGLGPICMTFNTLQEAVDYYSTLS